MLVRATLHTAPEPFENFSHVYDAENFQHSRNRKRTPLTAKINWAVN